ncbi:MAG: MBOAT family protein [Odoribacteraceae bacterium]|jgi:D-alanyl-lipoteichoic acid acyltransferase DltB (MBOAT superfamily)|nr:MBOAT family protein [Odoribacteraceae bacterium]
MLFNSIDFAIFLPIVFFLYWFICRGGAIQQNVLAVAASFVFYGWWDWRFLILMSITIACSWASGIWMTNVRERDREKKNPKRRARAVMVGNIVLNLLILGFFKYYNFFAQGFADAFTLFGKELNPTTLKIILPVGISFYTFQALSYSIDVYREKLQPTRNAVAFFAFVSFFPQLVAGPIERATNLLPQFYSKRVFDYAKASDGARQILWGLFKKMVVADNCALAVNRIFEEHYAVGGSDLVMGAALFAFQIYCDFSGYSDIAIGTARLFGIGLKKNFSFPYFSRDIAEFWRRWHISLTTWFRDYVYIPLGGSRGGRGQKIRNTFVIFLASGLWHGANWTFVVWGAYHALLFVPLLLLGRNRKYTDSVATGRKLPTLKEFAGIAMTFVLVTIGWIIFRARDMRQTIEYMAGMCDASLFSIPIHGRVACLYAVIFLVIEWLGRGQEYAIERLPVKRAGVRWVIYGAIALFIATSSGASEQFIYFQF